MGAWGTSLYSNDTTCDIRGDYLDLLRRGNTNETVAGMLIEKNRDVLCDEEEAPLFWFALADTQWNYGRLLPQVKEKALYYLQHREPELQRWLDSGEAQAKKWMKTLDKLQEKLQQPQPPEKKVYKYRLYHCKWALGDVFSYRFTSDYSKETGFYGQYVVFRKVSEANWHPGHIVPIVQVYSWIGTEIPSLAKIYSKPIMPSCFTPPYKGENRYLYKLLSTSERAIPKDNLTWLENRQGNDIIPYNGDKYMWFYESTPVGWEGSCWNNTFEHVVIRMYTACINFMRDYPGETW